MFSIRSLSTSDGGTVLSFQILESERSKDAPLIDTPQKDTS